ncbi:MAG TPA: hypothetical protein VF647_18955 [Longimicrobium sp.]|jgi:hypothetical protein
MKTRQWFLAGLLVLAACGESATAPDANPLHEGGGLMGSGTVTPPPPPPPTDETTQAASDTTGGLDSDPTQSHGEN